MDKQCLEWLKGTIPLSLALPKINSLLEIIWVIKSEKCSAPTMVIYHLKLWLQK